MSIPGITAGAAANGGSGAGTAPLLGSKVSLISQAEIRYEGILYTVDPAEKTIALAKVHSFGTEDRPTENPLPPQADVYEYIIFQAGNIKDLKVCESPQPATAGPWPKHGNWGDPAILSASKEQKGASHNQEDYLTSAGSALPHLRNSEHGNGAQRGRQANRGRGGGRGFGNRGGGQQQRGGGTMGGFANNFNSFGGYRGVRGRGVGYGNNFSNDGTQQNLGGFVPGQMMPGDRSGFRAPGFSPRGRGGGGARGINNRGMNPQNRNSPQGGIRRMGGGEDQRNAGRGIRSAQNDFRSGFLRNNRDFSQDQNERRQRSRATSTGSVGGDFSNNKRSGSFGNYGISRGRGQGQNRGFLYRGGNMFGFRNDGFQNRRQNFGQRSANRNRGARGAGFRRGAARLSSATGVPTCEHPQLVIPTDEKEEYEEEFDFEKAEQEFQQKINDHQKEEKENSSDFQQKESEDENSQKRSDEINQKIIEGNEEKNKEQTAELMIEIYYDKTKSFFDKISRDTDEEQQSRDQKQTVDWAKERQLNQETFGDMALRAPYRQPINNRFAFNRHQGAGGRGGTGFRRGIPRFRGRGGFRPGAGDGAPRPFGYGGFSFQNRFDGRQMNRNRIQA